MSDFLSRLVDRSTGSAPAARPVIAPLFGPGPAADPGVEAALPAAAARVEIAALPHVAEPASWRQEARAAAPEPAGPMPSAAADPPQSPAARPPAPPDVAGTATPLPVRVVLPPAHVEQPPTTAAGSLPPAPAEQFAAPTSGHDAPPRAEATSPAPPSHPAAPLDRPAPLWPDVERRSQPGHSAEEAPVVVVNIGRIEVRAERPPAPLPAPAPRPAAVSLEEYLRPKRRNR